MEMKNRKAISPVIATVILVAVAITVAIAVSYWMSGITSSYTKFEKVEIETAICTPGVNGWTIALSLKNSGTNTATITNVFVNDNLAATGVLGAATLTTDVTAAGYTLASGQSGTVNVYIGNAWVAGGAALTSGTSINIKLHSAGGMDYIKLLELV